MAATFAIVHRVSSPSGVQLAVHYNPDNPNNPNAILRLAPFNAAEPAANQRWIINEGVPATIVPQAAINREARPLGDDFVATPVPVAGEAPQLWNFDVVANDPPPPAPGLRGTLIVQNGVDAVWEVNDPIPGAQVALGPDNNALSQRWFLIPLN